MDCITEAKKFVQRAQEPGARRPNLAGCSTASASR